MRCRRPAGSYNSETKALPRTRGRTRRRVLVGESPSTEGTGGLDKQTHLTARCVCLIRGRRRNSCAVWLGVKESAYGRGGRGELMWMTLECLWCSSFAVKPSPGASSCVNVFSRFVFRALTHLESFFFFFWLVTLSGQLPKLGRDLECRSGLRGGLSYPHVRVCRYTSCMVRTVIFICTC